MGEPVRVMDVAIDLIRVSGRNPDSVPIVVTGLRPGEKLHEELFYADEDVEPTQVPKVLRSTNGPRPRVDFVMPSRWLPTPIEQPKKRQRSISGRPARSTETPT